MAGAGIQSNAKAAAGPDRVFAALKVKQRQARLRHARRWHRERVKPAAAIPPGVASALQSIAACESGGNPRAVGGGGTYRGKYQFTYSTWASVGGSGDPAAAPEAEQDRRAAMLYARDGRSQWPVCGR
ncbi:MAG: transglycosylase family protein [Actinobacteria bacterium]|nr:transglycosylase family protein [Actinomycetota bacterium]